MNEWLKPDKTTDEPAHGVRVYCSYADRSGDTYGTDIGEKVKAMYWPTRYHLRVIVRHEDETYVATSPTLPGLVSQGDTLDEALSNFNEAAAGVIRSYRDGGEPVPLSTDDMDEGEGEVVYAGWITFRI